MAEQIISPGVFTRENDLSFLPQGVGAIGAAIIGPTEQGPAFVPTVIRSFAEFENRFGPLSPDTFVPQTVREYLKSAGSVTVCRVLAGGGWRFKTGVSDPIAIIAEGNRARCDLSGLAGLEDEDSTLIIPNADGTIVTFTLTDGTAFASSTATIIGTEGMDSTAKVTQGMHVAFTAAIAAGTLKMSLSPGTYTNETKLTLTQNVAGEIGNKLITGTHTAASLQHSGSAGATSGSAPNGFSGGGGEGMLLGVVYPSKSTEAEPNLLGSKLTESASLGLNAAGGLQSTLKLILSGVADVVTETDVTASLNPTNTNYLERILGSDPNNSKNGVVTYAGTPGYSYINFKQIQTDMLATDSITGYGAAGTNTTLGLGSGSNIVLAKLNSTNMDFSGSIGNAEMYSYSSTPYIQSQIAKGRKDLFRFHTINHGDMTNTEYKISIANLREPADIDNEEQYSKFSVLVRKYGDKDKKKTIIEQYDNCNLDPDSVNYIGKRIGDRYPQYNDTLDKVELLGNYPNISNCIRVEVDPSIEGKATSPKLSPKGFKAIKNTFNTSSLVAVNATDNLNAIQFPSASYELSQSFGTSNVYNSGAFLGWRFNNKAQDNFNWIKPIPETADNNAAGDFSVEDGFGHTSSSLWVGSLSQSVSLTGTNGPTAGQLKFTVPFQGGQDGIAPWKPKFTGAESTLAGSYTDGDNLYGFDMNTTDAAGYKGYKKALDILSNQDEYDINMLSMPGVIKSIHSDVTNLGIDMVEARGDTFFVMDLSRKDASVNTAVSDASGLDSNYTGV